MQEAPSNALFKRIRPLHCSRQSPGATGFLGRAGGRQGQRGLLPSGATRRQTKILVGCSGVGFRGSFLPLFPPPLPEAGRRRGLPGSAARARAGSEGSARRLGPRRGALGRGSVNIHEAPPLLRGPPDPGARRPPLCPGLVRSLLTRGRGLRGPALEPRAVRETATQRRTRARGVRSQAAPRPAPAGPGLSAPREGVGRGGGRRTLPSPGRAGRGPRSRDSKVDWW